MPDLIEWKSLEPRQVGFVGFLGHGTVCHIVPSVDDKWPWQVQFQSDAYCGEWTKPARNLTEAQWIAELGVERLLCEFCLVPNSLLPLDSEEMATFRNRRRECGDVDRTVNYHDWLDEIGWYTQTKPEVVADRGAVTFIIGERTVTGYFDDDQAENLGIALFEAEYSRPITHPVDEVRAFTAAVKMGFGRAKVAAAFGEDIEQIDADNARDFARITEEEANRRRAVAEMVIAELQAAEAIEDHIFPGGEMKSNPVEDIRAYIDATGKFSVADDLESFGNAVELARAKVAQETARNPIVDGVAAFNAAFPSRT